MYRPQGLWVRLLKQGVVPQNSDRWTEPLIVLVKYAGPLRTPNLYVNSKLVTGEDFGRVLKLELGRRRERVVFVGGDDIVPYQYVANLIDVARGNQATVYFHGHREILTLAATTSEQEKQKIAVTSLRRRSQAHCSSKSSMSAIRLATSA